MLVNGKTFLFPQEPQCNYLIYEWLEEDRSSRTLSPPQRASTRGLGDRRATSVRSALYHIITAPTPKKHTMVACQGFVFVFIPDHFGGDGEIRRKANNYPEVSVKQIKTVFRASFLICTTGILCYLCMNLLKRDK